MKEAKEVNRINNKKVKMMMAEELVSIQKNEYKATIYGELAEPLQLRTITLLHWSFNESLKWVRSASEEGSKVMRRYTLLMDMSFLQSKVVKPCVLVHEAVNGRQLTYLGQ